ncbi:unnamed protein product [Amaranthus hypochondriacus]
MEGKNDMGIKNRKPNLKPINNNKIIRKKKNKRFSITLHEIVDYLNSDSYFYSHIISCPAPPPASSVFGLDIGNKAILSNKDKLFKDKLVGYLKSDTYMYAPLECTQHHDDIAVKTVISPTREQELQFIRVSGTVLSSKSAWQNKRVPENPVIEKRPGDHFPKDVAHKATVISPQTPVHQEQKKQAVRRSNRKSTYSG